MNTKNTLPAVQRTRNPTQRGIREQVRNFLVESEENYSWQTITADLNSIPHNWIYDLFQDSCGRIWIGTWGGGLCCRIENIWKTYTSRDGLYSNAVTCIREANDGVIWIATDRGLNRWSDDQIQRAGLEDRSLLHLCVDQENQLWIGSWRNRSNGSGLHLRGANTSTIIDIQNEAPGYEIIKIFEDSRSRIWTCTYDRGIGSGAAYLEGSRWKNFTMKDGLLDNCVYSIFEDPEKNIWLGTLGGISIYDGKRWESITTANGLVDNRVYSMLIDAQHQMWFGTERGVSRYDGRRWKTFTTQDGLVENLVRTIMQDEDGNLWFGTYPYESGRGGISIANRLFPKKQHSPQQKFLRG